MKIVRHAALGSLLAIALSISAAMASSGKTELSQLATAKTVEVHEVFSKIDENGVLKPQFKMLVDLSAGGAGVKVLVHPTDPKMKVAYYIANPKQEFEYYGDSNNFREIKPDDNGHASSQIRYLGCVDLLQNDGKDTADDATRTISTVTLDGKKMILQSDVRKNTVNGATVLYTDDLWTDAATGLPYRRTGYATTGTKTVANLSVDFTDWKFNIKLSSTFFDFAPPADAKPLVIPVPISAGVMAPDFKVVDPHGDPVHLSDFKGKIVIVDFWATWCGPCQQSMPHLDKVYHEVKDQDVVVLAVCVWDKKTLYDRWVTAKAQTYSFPTAFDPAADEPGDNIAKTLYQVTAIPATYVIDKDGKISAYISGYTGEGDHRLQDALTKLGVTFPIASE
jgi:thiol-disulfide isomerase/thioredoxin